MIFGQTRHNDSQRPAGLFGSSNTPATLFGGLTLLTIVDLARTYHRRRRQVHFDNSDVQRLATHLARPQVALALTLTFLSMTFSRAGVAVTVLSTAALVGVVLMTGPLRRGVRAPMLVGGAAVVLGILAACMLPPQADMLKQRVLTAQADSANRVEIYAAHWAASANAPLGGYGLTAVGGGGAADRRTQAHRC